MLPTPASADGPGRPTRRTREATAGGDREAGEGTGLAKRRACTFARSSTKGMSSVGWGGADRIGRATGQGAGSTKSGAEELEEAIMLMGSKAALRWRASGEVGGGEGGVEEGGRALGAKGTAWTVRRKAGTVMAGSRRRKEARAWASGILQSWSRCPQPRQLRQRTGSRQSRTRWSVAKQRKQPFVCVKGLGAREDEGFGSAGESAAWR